jgi:predicted TIM-barrel fold metal-dependent hydrolase
MTTSPHRLVLVSSDCHAGIPRADYRQYLESKYHGDFDDYDASLGAWWETSPPFADDAMEDREVMANQFPFHDSAGRLQDLEDNGVVAEVLFPGASPQTSVPWSDFLSSGAYRARTPRQRELQTAGERAYNRWLAEFCGDTPNRRVALGFAAFQDVDEAVADIRWAAEQDMRGILMPSMAYDVPEYCQGWYWDPIWAAMEEHGLSLNFHGGYGLPELGVHQSIVLTEAQFYVRRSVVHLVMSGVFDRFPGLRVAITESTALWAPQLMKELDAAWEAARGVKANGRAILFEDKHLCERPPSEYWFAHYHVGASLLSYPEMVARHEIGIDGMMYGNDYPHPEGTWGRQASWLQASIGRAGGTEEEVRKILGLNAARLYGLDVAALQPIADRVGPEVGDVLHALDDEEVAALLADAAGGGRALAVQHLHSDVAAANAQEGASR